MAMKIDRFRGESFFLSNFFSSRFVLEGIEFPNGEAAFQAMKTLDDAERRRIAALKSPGDAKRAGRRVKLRPDWEDAKTGVMRSVLEAKFGQNPDLAAKLIATGDAELIEGNDWNDRCWGVDLRTGEGENRLGKLLMELREKLRSGGADA